MTLKEKFLILWILGAMLLAFLASHTLAVLVAGFEHVCACGWIPAVALEVTTAVFSCLHS